MPLIPVTQATYRLSMNGVCGARCPVELGTNCGFSNRKLTKDQLFIAGYHDRIEIDTSFSVICASVN